MIAFAQPFGLNDPGGGSRILRALVEDAPMPYVSICTRPAAPVRPHTREIHLPVRPHLGRVESTRLARYVPTGALEVGLSTHFKRRLQKELTKRGVTVVHAIPHGMDFWYAREVAWAENMAYVLNVHDDLEYNIGQRTYYPTAVDRLSRAWKSADRRFVISNAMATAYQKRFGDEPCETVTDGLLADQIADVPVERPHRKVFYFMGAMHLSYHPNVRALLEALVQHGADTHGQPTFVVRGSDCPVQRPGVSIDKRPFADEAAVHDDFADVDVLYFPLPFGKENESFVRYSLSTKLVTYLGTGIPILYHGPRDSAAGNLLARHDAAVIVDSHSAADLQQGMDELDARGDAVAANALALGRDQFRLTDQHATFWGGIQEALAEERQARTVEGRL